MIIIMDMCFIFFLSSFEALLLQKEEIEQKYLHLLQILDSEKTAKLSLLHQCEELAAEVSRLKTEVCWLIDRFLSIHT